MKKSIIAAGAASVALAAMPIVGAFANTSVNDNITATLTPGCTVTDSLDKQVNITLAPGNITTTPQATSVSVTCNSTSWTITAVGASNTYEESSLHATSLIARNGTEGSYTYAEIPTGTSTSASSWAFKVADLYDPSTGATLASGATVAADASPSTGDPYDYKNFSAIPENATTIVIGTAPVTMQLKTQYQVYTASNQAGGTYQGKVTYTVVDGA
ncbi:hypothetical protein IJG27_02920 [Candidatus Saccharibacteria bacterium]|nr:hypothetical protein [Candidatus Saccharibacteria bacterium]MBQ6461123.1 hypothetical protein [Candidatus Saccharibacteria bacterium]